jgi:uncharacterized protein with HEPN domain
MTERIVTPRLADIIEAIERIRRVLGGVTLEAFEQNWEKRWLVERGIEVISEASRHLTDDIKERRTEIPWSKVAGIGNVLRHAYDHVAPDVLWLHKTIWQQSKKKSCFASEIRSINAAFRCRHLITHTIAIRM